MTSENSFALSPSCPELVEENLAYDRISKRHLLDPELVEGYFYHFFEGILYNLCADHYHLRMFSAGNHLN